MMAMDRQNWDTATLTYARKQLEAYGRRMAGDSWDGTGIVLKVDTVRVPVEDADLDDGIEISLNQGRGYIIGSNPRAVLIGVYQALEHLGCRFLRPGPDGEVIPALNMRQWTVAYRHSASSRYRGVVIEGADSLETVLDFLEWMPKLGYNMFFTQFKSIALFLKRYYTHPHNPYRSSLELPPSTLAWMEETITRKIKQLGLLQHTVGHGWTSEAVGLDGCDWEPIQTEPAEEDRELLALVDGKRQLYGGIPSETNLCYSNPLARQKIIDAVLCYVRSHPNADFVHFWLADNCHNFCTCEHCRTQSPSDWYVVLLNELDAALTAEGSSVRIAFLNYFDLLWPPKTRKIKNSRRFTMIFAPITRQFGSSYADANVLRPVPPYELNRSDMPRRVEENMWLLDQWREVFQGDCFDFDYYMGKAHYGDPGYAGLAHTISRDIDKLHAIGLKGILSCQELRAAFPNSLPSYMLGKRLWDISCSEEDVTREYYQAAYGDAWAICREYFGEISDCFDIDYWYGYCRAGKNPDIAAKARKAQNIANVFADRVPGITVQNSAERLSQFYLRVHVQYVQLFAQVIASWAEGDKKEAAEAWKKFADYLRINERSIERAFDVFRILDIGSYMPWCK